MSHFSTSGGQCIGASASASFLPVIIQDWFPKPLSAPQKWGSLWPYHPEHARSRLISEAKQGQAWLVLGWENEVEADGVEQWEGKGERRNERMKSAEGRKPPWASRTDCRAEKILRIKMKKQSRLRLWAESHAVSPTLWRSKMARPGSPDRTKETQFLKSSRLPSGRPRHRRS